MPLVCWRSETAVSQNRPSARTKLTITPWPAVGSREDERALSSRVQELLNALATEPGEAHVLEIVDA